MPFFYGSNLFNCNRILKPLTRSDFCKTAQSPLTLNVCLALLHQDEYHIYTIKTVQINVVCSV